MVRLSAMLERVWRVGRNDSLGQRLWWLITGRLAFAVVLWLLAGAQWSREQLGVAGRGSLIIFMDDVLVSLCYALMLRFLRRLRTQAGLQILIDVLLVTWLVWVTGDLHSPYAALYIIIISVASIFLGPRGALVAAVGCALAFTMITIAITVGAVAPYSRNLAETNTINAVQAIGLNDIAFLVVGLLAARLAERQTRSDVQLLATTQTLANLRALHERIVESIRSGVVTTDLRGLIYTFNAAAEEITGYRAGDIRGKEASILFGELSQHIEDSMRAALSGNTSPRFEADCLTPEGHIRRLGFSIFPLSTEAGEQTGLVITFQDLTEVRALEDTSRRQDRLAAVGRVAASIAHEIRNPLAAMRGSIQVLRSEMENDSSQAELMEIILRESDRLNRIITDYLAYARQRSHALESVDVRDLLHETFTLLRHSPEIREEHRLEEDLPAEPMLAQADAAQLRQVFWNLARNALQAMENGGTLRAELRRSSTWRLRITFTDTGVGMTP